MKSKACMADMEDYAKDDTIINPHEALKKDYMEMMTKHGDITFTLVPDIAEGEKIDQRTINRALLKKKLQLFRRDRTKL